MNCEFHDDSAYNECREPVAERVVDKHSANFCDAFSPAAGSKTTPESAASSVLDELDSLFTKK